MSIFVILGQVAQLLATAGPYLLAAETAFSKGGWPALVAYLESIIAIKPAGVDVNELSKVTTSLRANLKSAQTDA